MAPTLPLNPRISCFRYLPAARKGQSVLLKSRYGNFKIVPVTEEDTIEARIAEGLRDALLMESGKLPKKSAISFLDEL